MNILLTANQFSSQSLTSMIVVALACTLIPFVFLGYYRAKTQAKTSSFFIGMAFYVLAALMAEGLFNMLFYKGLVLILSEQTASQFFNRTNHPVFYAMYGAIVAGVFEETGKYLGLKKCMKDRTGKENAFLFGVGHGSFEMIAYGSSLFMGNIVIAFMVNSFGMDGYFEKLGITGDVVNEQKQIIEQMIAIAPIENVAAGIERVLALVLQTSLTIFIFLALNYKKLKPLFPIAIVLHIIGYVPTYLMQVSILKSLPLNLCLTGAVVIFTASYAYRMFHQVSEKSS